MDESLAVLRRTALFVSWCRPDLIRPRTVQVGRVAKGLAKRRWNIPLICSTFENEADLFDRELNRLYGGSFSSVTRLLDLSSYSTLARKNFDKQQAAKPATAPEIMPWPQAVSRRVLRWARYRIRPTVISFAQPWETHLAILEAKKQLPKLRWIAHFSDPWADSPYLDERPPYDKAAALVQERAVIEMADAVIFVTDSTADLAMRKYPAEWRKKAVVIPHTTDLELAETIHRAPRDNRRFRLTHTGTLYSGRRSGGELFAALRELRAEPAVDDFELRLVGEMPPSVEDLIRKENLTEVVSWATPLYFYPSLAEMSEADALLVIDADFETSPFLPSKIFDYLMFDKPIVALTPSGSSTDVFLRRLGYPTVPPSDIAGIKRLIGRLIEESKAGALRPTAAHLEARKHYDLHTISGRYAEQFLRLNS